MNAGIARFVLGLFVGVVCGGALGFLAAGDPRPNDRAGLSPEDSRSVRAADTSHDDDLVAPVVNASTREAAPTDGALRVDESLVREVAATHRAPAIAASTGDGALTGRAVDTDGAPVAGVLIVFDRIVFRGSTYDERGAAGPARDDLEEALRDAAESFARKQASRVRAVTGADGTFRVEGLPAANWTANAYLAGHDVDVAGAQRGRVETGDEVEVVVRPLIDVPIDVRMPDGSQPAEADIAALGEDSAQVRWTPDAAFLRVVPGKYRITAGAGGDRITAAPWSSEEVVAEFVLGTAPETIVLQLSGTLGIRGDVEDAGDGLSRSIVTVLVKPVGADATPDTVRFVQTDNRQMVHAGRGYQFLDLDPGRYAVGVSRKLNNEAEGVQIVDVVDRIVELDLALDPVDLSRSLRVHVYGPDGSPLDRATPTIESDGLERAFHFQIDSQRFDDGSYAVEMSEEMEKAYFEEPGDAEFRLIVRHRDYGRIEAALVPGQVEATVRFREPGSIVVDVAGAAASGNLERLSVRLRPASAGDGSMSRLSETRAAVSSEGRATFEHLQPGTYIVELSVGEPGRFSANTLDEQEVTVESGVVTVDLALPPLHTLEVAWPDGKPGSRMRLSATDDLGDPWNTRSTTLGDDGVARFEEVPPGTYRLTATVAGETREMSIDVPATGVRFEPMVFDALRVSIDDAGGDLARAGLRDGDLVIGRDGAEFDGDAPRNLLNEVTTSKSAEVRLLVLRGSQRLEVVLRGADFGLRDGLGGRFDTAVRSR